MIVGTEQVQGNGQKIPVTLFKGFSTVSTAADGADTIEGGAGDDVVWSGSGDDRINLGEGNDQAQGMSGADHIEGGAGNDQILGDGLVLEGFLNFTAPANNGDDFVDGGTGKDALFGEAGQDALDGAVSSGTLNWLTKNDRDSQHYQVT